MAFKKMFVWVAEGIVLIGIVFAVNAQLVISLYYQALKLLDKVRDLVL